MFLSESVPETTLGSVPGSSLRRNAPAYVGCRFQLSPKPVSNLGSCKRTKTQAKNPGIQINLMSISN